MTMLTNDMGDHLSKIKKLMMNSSFYPHDVEEPIQMRETHISLVFLTGKYAYKVKKPLSFGDILDFSSLEKRKHFCHEEIRLNSRLAPELYLGVVGITNTALQEDLSVEGIFEYAVKMKQLPPDSTLHDLLAEGRAIPIGTIQKIADIVAEFHQKADRLPQYGSYEVIYEKNDENFRTASQYMEINESYRKKIYEWMQSHKNLFKKRVDEGKIIDGHGDIQSRNIFIHKDKIYIFDCVEFNQALRAGDVAEEVAFLAMDLEYLGYPDLSQAYVNQYVDKTLDADLLRLLPFYKAYRAHVRGKVALFNASQGGDPQHVAKLKEEAQKYFQLAEKYANELE